jgi:Tat protein secretion system quality control protein TatD with DNase activity
MLNLIPLDKILLESDAPSMFNKDIYEKEEEFEFYYKDEKNQYKNHPISIISLSKRLAELRKISYEEFSQQLHKNYIKLIQNLL